MGGSLTRVKNLLGSGQSNRQIMGYVVLLVVFVLVVLYYLIARTSS